MSDQLNVYILGSGAREHALTTRIKRSKLVNQLKVLPGNDGIPSTLRDQTAEGLEAHQKGVKKIAKYLASRTPKPDLVICGPEVPLAEGIHQYLKDEGIACYGPDKYWAQLESSKAFSKEIMQELGIPTASYKSIHGIDAIEPEAMMFFDDHGAVVIKASGLAGGKGVFVCQQKQQIQPAVEQLKKSMAEAAETVVLEELLVGREVSAFYMLGPQQADFLGFAVDFKRRDDADQGPNTGGMGTYTPVPWLDGGAESVVREKVLEPLLEKIHASQNTYNGFLYIGLMWTATGPKVIEFNVRLGDPEAQVLALNGSTDWLETIAMQLGLVSEGATATLENQKYHVGVVMTDENYPFGAFDASASQQIDAALFEPTSTTTVFSASLKSAEEGGYRNGAGRVLTVVGSANSLEEAKSEAYAKVSQISKQWTRAHFRKDIAQKICNEN